MKRTDLIGWVFTVILSLLYMPLSLFSWLMQMASESTMYANNPVYISLIYLFCAICFFIPLLCVVAIVLAIVFRLAGFSDLSFAVQFVPLAVFHVSWVLLFIAELFPPSI